MMKHKLLALALTLSASFLFQACQKGELAELQAAQLCLNTATAGTAQNCVANIASNTTAYAYSLKCTAIFIEQGFSTPSSFINALNAINSSGCSGTCSPTLNALTTLNFGNNTTAANNAFSVCSKAEVKFYTQISSMFKIGTLAYAAGSLSGTPTASQLETAVASVDAAVLGELAQTTYTSVCADTTGASAETKSYCNELALAVNTGGTSAAIGACLQARLADPNKTTCP